jgi:hypothetical protein
MEPGDQIGDRRSGAHRLAVGRAGYGHEAAHRLRDEIEGGPVAIRSSRAEPADIGVDEIGPQFSQTRLAEPHRFQNAGPVIPVLCSKRHRPSVFGFYIANDILVVNLTHHAE